MGANDSQSGERCLCAVDDEGDAFAAADAEGGDAALRVALLHCVEEGDEDAGAGSADGVAEGDGAAVDVDAGGVEAEELVVDDGDDGEGFVDLVEIDLVLAELGAGEGARWRRRGRW